MTVLAALAIRSSVILLAGLALHALLAARSAALRHCVLAITILAAAAVVPLSVALPAWQVAVPVQLPAALQPANEAPVTERISVRRREPAAPRQSTLPLAAIVWGSGFAVTAAMLLTGIVGLGRIASRAARVHDGPWASLAPAVARTYGLRRDVIVLQTDVPDLLATSGYWRPRILLPSHAGEWADDRIRVVLCHELAHVWRGDWIVQIGAQALLTLVWFNPLMWVACRRLRRESEQACDDAVLDRGVPPRDYAAHLLELARQCRRPQPPWASALPMAHPSTLERRIAAMLNPRLDRTGLSRRAAVMTGLLLFAVTLATAAFRPAQGVPGALSGSVYDATGAVLPAVELTLEDAQHVTSQATTDAAGRFQFPGVTPGRYVLAASLAGFRSLRHEFELRNGADWDRAVTLQVGDVRETITVREQRRAAAPAGPSQSRAAQPVRVGGNLRAPRKEYDVKPIYPAAMRDAGREGTVPLDAIIGRDGTVTSVRVLSAQVHPDFAIAAVDAVRQWRFSPTLLNGVPVEVVMTVSVQFNLSN